MPDAPLWNLKDQSQIDWVNSARQATENARRMPFALDPRQLTQSQTANTSMNFPDIMQTAGMQPIMGPGGKNIAPSLAAILDVKDPNDASKLPFGGAALDTSHGLAGLIEFLRLHGASQEQQDQVGYLGGPPVEDPTAPIEGGPAFGLAAKMNKLQPVGGTPGKKSK